MESMDRDRDDRTTDPVTRPSAATREAEREDARVHAGADRPPTEEEARDAPTTVTDEQRAHEREMHERGANQKGEGRI